MPYLACGINYKLTPIEVREKFSYDHSQTVELLEELRTRYGVQEVVSLSTCNRTEIYTLAEHRQAIGAWMHSVIPQLGIQDHQQVCYSYQGGEAVRHLLRVACGIDSMALGEPQIFGQIKDAYQLALQTGAIGKQLQQLFPAIFEAAKQIRQESDVCRNPVSLANIVLHIAERTFESPENTRALLIGTGEITRQIATYFHSRGISLVIANRTYSRAKNMAENFGAEAIPLDHLPEHLIDADIVISATRSPHPLITESLVEKALLKKQKKYNTPLLLIDLAVPRDIEPSIATLKNTQLYYLDDLKSIIANNYKNREQAAAQAETLVNTHVELYMKKRKMLDAASLIAQYRNELETLRDQEIQKALSMLSQGECPAETLQLFAHNLLNKIMHKPTVNLRKAASNEKHELLIAAKELWET
jgi:glutamyl-tRNA reductase